MRPEPGRSSRGSPARPLVRHRRRTRPPEPTATRPAFPGRSSCSPFPRPAHLRHNRAAQRTITGLTWPMLSSRSCELSCELSCGPTRVAITHRGGQSRVSRDDQPTDSGRHSRLQKPVSPIAITRAAHAGVLADLLPARSSLTESAIQPRFTAGSRPPAGANAAGSCEQRGNRKLQPPP
jgi:hypothetical protein